MNLRIRQLVILMLIGLMGLSPVVSAAGSNSMDQGTMHCLEHSHDNHDSGQCDQNMVCSTAHCFAHVVTAALPGALSISTLSVSIQHAAGNTVPASTSPSSLFRPPIA